MKVLEKKGRREDLEWNRMIKYTGNFWFFMITYLLIQGDNKNQAINNFCILSPFETNRHDFNRTQRVTSYLVSESDLYRPFKSYTRSKVNKIHRKACCSTASSPTSKQMILKTLSPIGSFFKNTLFFFAFAIQRYLLLIFVFDNFLKVSEKYKIILFQIYYLPYQIRKQIWIQRFFL